MWTAYFQSFTRREIEDFLCYCCIDPSEVRILLRSRQVASPRHMNPYQDTRSKIFIKMTPSMTAKLFSSFFTKHINLSSVICTNISPCLSVWFSTSFCNILSVTSVIQKKENIVRLRRLESVIFKLIAKDAIAAPNF